MTSPGPSQHVAGSTCRTFLDHLNWWLLLCGLARSEHLGFYFAFLQQNSRWSSSLWEWVIILFRTFVMSSQPQRLKNRTTVVEISSEHWANETSVRPKCQIAWYRAHQHLLLLCSLMQPLIQLIWKAQILQMPLSHKSKGILKGQSPFLVIFKPSYQDENLSNCLKGEAGWGK